jgi:phage terminase large subunit GpA-like protein
MDAVTDPTVTQITVMKSARVGYTKCLDNVIGFFISQDPSPILMVLPRVEDAEDYSRSEIAPMLRDTPVLAELTGELTAKDPNQRIAKRMFRNGASIAFVGANSPAGFRRVTARVVLFDEVDGFPVAGAGDEGDQIALGIKRSETFWNRKVICGSTPTLKGVSRIEKLFNESDQRRYFVPCPQCGHRQTLKWRNLVWNKGPNGEHLPETAHFVCEGNGCIIEESSKAWMLERGEWVAEKPFTGHAGFHIWAAYSLFPNACWANLVREFLRVHKDQIQLQTFANTVWGETWEGSYETVDGGSLLSRGENYGPESLPDTIADVVAGVDVQPNRFELLTIGFGDREECWLVDLQVIYGDPAQQPIWVDLDKALLSKYRTVGGRELRIQACCIDTGGHHAHQVHQFCRTRYARRIFPIKGTGGPRQLWPRHASRTHAGDQVFLLGVDWGKDAIYGRLRNKTAGPGYIHFPVGEPFGQEFFDQLTSERCVPRYRMGIPYRVWELPSGARNEALDCFVYALAGPINRSAGGVRPWWPLQLPRFPDSRNRRHHHFRDLHLRRCSSARHGWRSCWRSEVVVGVGSALYTAGIGLGLVCTRGLISGCGGPPADVHNCPGVLRADCGECPITTHRPF